MKVKQISVFMENHKGRLSEVTALLTDAGINLRAATIADTADFGILRMICEEPDKAIKVLKKAGLSAEETDVIGVKLMDEPGALSGILYILEKKGVNIEYLYTTLMEEDGKVVVIFRAEDTDHCIKIIEEEGIHTIKSF